MYWACAQIDQRREHLARHVLSLSGFQTYAPKIRGPRKTSLPLFPGYVFVLITLQWWQARWTVGVRRLIQNGGSEPAHIPDQIIEELRMREDRDGLITLPPRRSKSSTPFLPGDKVRVKSGPMSGLSALVEGMKPHQRVEVLLTMLGGLRRVELAVTAVERLA
jgi:transcriptional antiterminator RfaH